MNLTTSPNSASDFVAIGEVVETSTTSFVAQCLEMPRSSAPRLFDPPDFGSLVKIRMGKAVETSESANEDDDLEENDPFVQMKPSSIIQWGVQLHKEIAIAVVTGAKMSSLDAGRRPSALGFENEDDMRLHHPQLFELITTEFTGVLIGFVDFEGHLHCYLPPKPPRIHAHVAPCTSDEVEAATTDLTFLRRILDGRAGGDIPAEELASAVLRLGWTVRNRDTAYLRDAGTQLIHLVGGDYDRLQRVVRGVLG